MNSSELKHKISLNLTHVLSIRTDTTFIWKITLNLIICTRLNARYKSRSEIKLPSQVNQCMYFIYEALGINNHQTKPFLLLNLSTRSVLIRDFSGLFGFLDFSSLLSKLFLEISGRSPSSKVSELALSDGLF